LQLCPYQSAIGTQKHGIDGQRFSNKLAYSNQQLSDKGKNRTTASRKFWPRWNMRLDDPRAFTDLTKRVTTTGKKYNSRFYSPVAYQDWEVGHEWGVQHRQK
jgi:hypothetical protein